MRIKKPIFIIPITIFTIGLLIVATNTIITYPNPTNLIVAGKPNDWIGFYSSAIGSFIAIVVLIITLKQNEKNNNDLKKQQTNILIQTNNQHRLHNISLYCFTFIVKISPRRVFDIILSNAKIGNTNIESINSITTLMQDIYKSYEELLILVNFNDDIINIKESYSLFETYHNELTKSSGIIITILSKSDNQDPIETHHLLMIEYEIIRDSKYYSDFSDTLITKIKHAQTEINNKLNGNQ